MDFRERVLKIRAYSRAMVGAYLTADQKLALLHPILDDQNLIQQYDNSVAAHGLNLLQVTLFLDLVKDAVAFTLDRDVRAASLWNVLRLLSQDDLRGELRWECCIPRPSRWVGGNIEEEMRRLLDEQRKEASREEQAEDFDSRYAKVREKANIVFAGELATRLQKARNKLIAHYEMTVTGSEPKLVNPEDVGLMWGDVDDYFTEVEPLIFDAELIISNGSYVLDQFKENHKRIARKFWLIRRSIN
jgi:AbiU2